MAIELIAHDDVTRVRMWTRRSLAVGYDVSAYFVRGVLVDTGFRNVARDLAGVVEQLRPRAIVVTHWHEDHAGNAPTLAARVPLWIAPYTQAKLRERPRLKLYRHWTWGRPAPLTGPITLGDVAPLQVIATPGHSEDHHVVFDAESATLFAADLWLGVKVRVTGREENPYRIVESLARAIALRPQRMFDAHRGLVENPARALDAKRAWLEDMIAAVERRLDAGDGESAILKSVLGGEERTALLSQREYSRRNLIRAVARHRSGGTRP